MYASPLLWPLPSLSPPLVSYFRLNIPLHASPTSPLLVPAHNRANLINALDNPRHPFVGGQPLLPLQHLPIPASAFEQRLLEPKHVARNLGPNAGLCTQARNRDHRRQNTAEEERAIRHRPGRVRQEGTVVRVQDVDGKVGVRVAELGD